MLEIGDAAIFGGIGRPGKYTKKYGVVRRSDCSGSSSEPRLCGMLVGGCSDVASSNMAHDQL